MWKEAECDVKHDYWSVLDFNNEKFTDILNDEDKVKPQQHVFKSSPTRKHEKEWENEEPSSRLHTREIKINLERLESNHSIEEEKKESIASPSIPVLSPIENGVDSVSDLDEIVGIPEEEMKEGGEKDTSWLERPQFANEREEMKKLIEERTGLLNYSKYR